MAFYLIWFLTEGHTSFSFTFWLLVKKMACIILVQGCRLFQQLVRYILIPSFWIKTDENSHYPTMNMKIFKQRLCKSNKLKVSGLYTNKYRIKYSKLACRNKLHFDNTANSFRPVASLSPTHSTVVNKYPNCLQTPCSRHPKPVC